MKFKAINMVIRSIQDMVTEAGMMLLIEMGNSKIFMIKILDNITKTTNMIENTDGVSEILDKLLHLMIHGHILRRHITTTINTDGALNTGTE